MNVLYRIKNITSNINVNNSINRYVSTLNNFNASYLNKCNANYTQLTPISFLERSAEQYPTVIAHVNGNDKKTWGDVLISSKKIASSLYKLGIKKNDVVSIISPNSPCIFDCHFGIPGAGAVLHTINTRLDAKTIAFQLNHCQAKVLLVDSEFSKLIQDAIVILKETAKDYPLPYIIDINDNEYTKTTGSSGSSVGSIDYDTFVANGDSNFNLIRPNDEWDAIALNYTSGTTGDPKGVVVHHRGAYLNSLSSLVEWNMHRFPQFLWIVPMFHCNGWCFAWSMAANTGTSYFLRQIRAESLFDTIQKNKIEYLSGAPITMITMLAHEKKFKFNHTIKAWIAGAPPPPIIMKRFKDEIGISAQTAYGLTETYGPMSAHVPDPHNDWKTLNDEELLLKSTYQTNDCTVESMKVFDPETMIPVPADGKTVGEIFIKGNTVMKGYLGNESATLKAFENGWFHTGDLAVNHGRGRVEIKDRSKDIIISGGENISSIEVENILLNHSAIEETAVIAMPDAKWGEVPCAFITLRSAYTGNRNGLEEEILKWSKTKMAGFQTPKKVIILDSLPKTNTGKVQKFVLRSQLPK